MQATSSINKSVERRLSRHIQNFEERQTRVAVWLPHGCSRLESSRREQGIRNREKRVGSPAARVPERTAAISIDLYGELND